MNFTHIAADLAATVDSTVIGHLDGYDRLDLDPAGRAFLMLSSGEQTVIRTAQRLQLIGLDLGYYLDDRYQRHVLEALIKAAAVLYGVQL